MQLHHRAEPDVEKNELTSRNTQSIASSSSSVSSSSSLSNTLPATSSAPTSEQGCSKMTVFFVAFQICYWSYFFSHMNHPLFPSQPDPVEAPGLKEYNLIHYNALAKVGILNDESPKGEHLLTDLECPAPDLNKRIAIIRPFDCSEALSLANEMKSIFERLPACSDSWLQGQQERLGYKPVDLLLLFDHVSKDFPQVFNVLKENILDNDQVNKCFGRVAVLDIKIGMDKQNLDFNRIKWIFHDAELVASYRHFLYMEPNTWPIKENWIESIYQSSNEGDFWMNGPRATVSPSSLWFAFVTSQHHDLDDHINRNALYRLDDPCFMHYIERAEQYCGDETYIFDHCLFYYRGGFGQEHLLNQIAHRFRFTEKVANIGENAPSPILLPSILERSYLVHGDGARLTEKFQIPPKSVSVSDELALCVRT